MDFEKSEIKKQYKERLEKEKRKSMKEIEEIKNLMESKLLETEDNFQKILGNLN